MDRARLIGTAKEAVLLAMLEHDGYLSVRDILAIAQRREAVVSVPAVYRAIRTLEDQGFIVALDSAQQQRALENFRQLAEMGIMPPPDRASVMLFRLTTTGRALGHVLRLAQGPDPVPVRDIQQAANVIYAGLATGAAASSSGPTVPAT